MNEEIQQVQSLARTAADLVQTAEVTSDSGLRTELLRTASNLLELTNLIVVGSEDCDCAPGECQAEEEDDEEEVYEAFAAFLEAVFSEGTEEEEEEECDCLGCAIEAIIEDELAGEEFDLGLERQPKEVLYIIY